MRIGLAAVAMLFLSACGGGDAPAQGGSIAEEAPPHPGEKTYLQACFSCHAGGVGGAPRVGDTVSWQERLDKGRDVLLASTKNGLGTMPPMGLCGSCTDAEFEAVIDYMLLESGLE